MNSITGNDILFPLDTYRIAASVLSESINNYFMIPNLMYR